MWTILFHQGITSPSVHVHRNCCRLSGRSRGRRHARLQCSERPDANTRALLPPTVDMLDHGAVAKNFLQQMEVPELSRTQRSTMAEATLGQYGGEHITQATDEVSPSGREGAPETSHRNHRSRRHRFNSSPSTSIANSLAGRAEIV